MTREEAIETLKANYPDACFEQLRDAVDAAIAVLKKPEIVHCEECVYRNNTGTSLRWLPCRVVATGDHWFCGSGKRAERQKG